MELSNFTSFIEIGATLTIAFVAVEYTKEYTCIIAQKVFRFFDRIEEKVDHCKRTIDEETIDGLTSIEINGCNTGYKVEGLKRRKETIIQDIKEKEVILNKSVLENCNSKSYSSLSLFTFLFSITSLFISGIETDYTRFFWFVVSFLSFLYIATSWVFGESKKRKYWINYSSLKSVIYSYSAILIAGVILSCFIPSSIRINLIEYYSVAVCFTILLPYLNFVVFAIIIRGKSSIIFKEIDDTFDPIIDTCVTIQEETKKHTLAGSLGQEVKIELDTVRVSNRITIEMKKDEKGKLKLY